MTNRTTSRVLAAATALLALGAGAGCSIGNAAGADPERVDVVAAFYPLQFLAERIGGDAVRVTNLAKPGAEPHDLELTPSQVGQVSEAELIVYLKGFQPAVDDAVAQNGDDRTFDVTSVQPLLDASAGGHDHEGEEGRAEEHGGKDPHVWLDPTRLAAIGDQLAQRLGKADPDHAADYTARSAALRGDLTALDGEFTQGLRTCQRREIVTSHAAFGYLADRYRLEQVGITGLSPDVEPSPQRLAQVIEEAKEHRASTIFFETLVSPKVAETIAGQVGARTAVLDPIEGLAAGSGADYLSVMRTNLQTLRTALSCS
ncbi:zinc transport system substrate-binding protein [Micromonospora coriariae]|uniref:Zinc transport system substrate-binding protein n=1 Tax=Micromonospora coriariae TaxID=285665 RepID=A0A1C4WP36_9ACTN|nr:metal ABC transporter substrate-binding protein [Micromonospora coriariae]SCE97980.1 zinc transport system substrate-binding protein [Micromonospora coriariae]